MKICWALQRAFPEWYHSLREALLFPGYFSKILACPPFPCFALEVDANTTNSLWAILHFPGRYNNLLLFHRHSRGYLVFRLPVLLPLRGFLCDTTVTQVITSSKYVITEQPLQFSRKLFSSPLAEIQQNQDSTISMSPRPPRAVQSVTELYIRLTHLFFQATLFNICSPSNDKLTCSILSPGCELAAFMSVT